MNNLFAGIFETGTTANIEIGAFLSCFLAAIILGAAIAAVYSYRNQVTHSFRTTLLMIPAVVCVVIMMVNGNVGAGIAIVGIFGLVRFRSIPGQAKEIAAVFLAMGAGLICGMGYIGIAVLFTIVMSLIVVGCNITSDKAAKQLEKEKILKITIPENLDYEGVFDETIDYFAEKHELLNVKTTGLGSLFKLTYSVTMRDGVSEKEFIDKLRCRNGNLEISLSKQETKVPEL